jgi:hypothetical protein
VPHSQGRRRTDRWIVVAITIVAASALVTGVAFFLLPESAAATQPSVLERLHGPVDELWSLAYALAGALVLAGRYRRLSELEAAGLWLLAATLAVNAATILVVRQLGALPTLAPFALSAAVIFARLEMLKVAAGADRLVGLPKPPRALGALDPSAPAAVLAAAAPEGPDLFSTVVLAIIGSGGIAAFSSFLTLRQSRRQINAQADKLHAEAEDLVDQRSDRLAARLEREIGRLEAALDRERAHLERLEHDHAELRRLYREALERIADLTEQCRPTARRPEPS